MHPLKLKFGRKSISSFSNNLLIDRYLSISSIVKQYHSISIIEWIMRENREIIYHFYSFLLEKIIILKWNLAHWKDQIFSMKIISLYSLQQSVVTAGRHISIDFCRFVSLDTICFYLLLALRVAAALVQWLSQRSH